MDAMLQKHSAKHIYKVPEGLRELCTDISREVLRLEPKNLYGFVAEYVDTLLITRENTKIAVKVVNNILLGSQAILSILYRTGFSLEQIAVAAPRIQRAFREYLDAVDIRPVQTCEVHTCDEETMVSIRNILEATGSTRETAERAATVIQSAFRGHYERMALNEAQGKVQWQRAVTNTLDILRKAGATQTEISTAAKHVKFAYRSYYIRRNQKIDAPETEQELKKDSRILETAEAMQAVAWMEMMYQDSGLSLEKANEAATIIQKAYKKYRMRKGSYNVQKLESTKSMVVEAVIDNLHHKVFERVTSRENIPEKYGTREELMVASTKVQLAFKEHLRTTRISKEGYLELAKFDEEEYDEEEYDEDKETEEIGTIGRGPDSEYHPLQSEAKSDIEYTEQLTEAEMDGQEGSEFEITTEFLPASIELQAESETEYLTELELEEEIEELEEEKEIVKSKEKHKPEKAETEPNVAKEIGTSGDAAE